MHLSIDIETKSSIDIKKAGAYKYAQSPDFGILLFAYKWEAYPVEVIDLAAGETIPEEIVLALQDKQVVKHAYNAAFEWYCLNQAGYTTPIDQWRCTMVHGLYCGYPGGLDAIGKAMGIPEDKQKLASGKALIKYFCCPCKPTKRNGGRTWNLPMDDPNKWDLFKRYNMQDVDTEYYLLQILNRFPVPDEVEKEWQHDVEMNAYGIRVDTDLIEGALALDNMSTDELMARAIEITGLANPKSTAQLLGWVQKNAPNINIPNLQKATVEEVLSREDLPENVREMLQLKQKLGKTSVSKYTAMETTRGLGDRSRGLLQFYGANRTGRWSGRLVQMQNLPRNYLGTLDEARELVKKKNYEGIKMIYGNVPDTLSQLIRTAFIPSKGNKLIVSDYSAIEARVIAWLAGEQWVLDVFAGGGDIYCATASQMFGVPVEKHGVNGDLRQKGKVATLALGYQGGPGALIKMGALDMGIQEEELPDIVQKWREANPHIVQMWGAIDRAATRCVETGETTHPALKECDPARAADNEQTTGASFGEYSDMFLSHAPGSNLTFRIEADIANGATFLTVELPSGRKLFYNSPSIGLNRYNKPSIHYSGINQTTRKWEDQETYGGKLTENIVQAVARDCLAVTLSRVIEAGYAPVMHIHDEIVIDADLKEKLDDVNDIFAQPIDWAPGLLLCGAGFEASYYMKD